MKNEKSKIISHVYKIISHIIEEGNMIYLNLSKHVYTCEESEPYTKSQMEIRRLRR